MTNSPNSPSAALSLPSILLAFACLCGCQSTSTGPDSPRTTQPARTEASGSGHRGIDRAYLLAIANLQEEKKQALEDGRLKELSPAQMRELEDSFERRRQQLRGEWQEARARHAQMR